MLSRILNLSNENKKMSSFGETERETDLFTSFFFNEEDDNGGEDDFYESEETEFSYTKQDREESFSLREKTVFEHFERDRKFLGIITKIDRSNRTFSANLTCSDDLINRNVVFSIDDLPQKDTCFLDVGRRIIYIYGKQYRNGTVTNVSNIYFRKDANWTQREIELRQREADELYKVLSDKSE